MNKKYNTINKLENRQDKIIEKFSEKEQKLIIEAINIEYILTMVEEGHELSTYI